MNVFTSELVETPVGPMLAVAGDTALIALEFVDPTRQSRLRARLQRWQSPFRIDTGSNAVIERVRAWLEAYFAGASADIAPFGPGASGGPFERRVWAALCDIPAGSTCSYGDIAKRIGSPGASRAVGLANGANPIAIIVPCHRVIGSNGSLTGYGGGLDRKAWLLNHERRWRNALPLWLTDDLRAPASASVQSKGG